MQFKYKVLQVTPFFPPDIGGIANHASSLSYYLMKEGDNISIVAPRHIMHKAKDVKDYFQPSVRIRSFYLPGWPYPPLRSISIPMDGGFRIDSLIRNGIFDIVHAHGYHYPISWAAIYSARKHGVPIVVTLHNSRYSLNPYVLGGKTSLEKLFNKLVVPRILVKANAIIGLTKQMTEFAKELTVRQPIKHFTIPNGVNTNVYKQNLGKKQEYRLKYSLQQDSLVILFRGRFEHIKGIIEFAIAIKEILSKNRKVEAVVVGGGTLEAKVRSILHGIEGVHVLGWQTPQCVHEIYIASDIFVTPAKSEALPITIIEAMNACMHIVYTPVGGVPDILQGYTPKTMLTVTSSEEIQKKLTTVIEDRSFERDRGDSLVYAQKFDWSNIALDVNNVYAELKNGSS